MRIIQPYRNPRRVYCAGPLFNAAERREMELIAASLVREGFDAFVPHRDGFEFANVLPSLIEQGCEPALAGHCLHLAIFALDVYQVLVDCGSLVFNMNGRAPDEGGVAEMSMAWMLGKPLVIYKEDVRTAVCGRDNPLVVGQAGFRTVGKLQEIAGALAARIAAGELDMQAKVPCPRHLQRQLDEGELLWRKLQSLGNERPPETIARWVGQLYGPARQLALP